MARFGQVIAAMITPFDADGQVDLDGAAALAAWLVEQGNDALVLTGTTGEASVLTDDEQIAVWHAVRSAVDVPLIAGSGTNDTAHATGLTAAAAAAGMDAVLIVTPYYVRPPQAGIEAHFRALAQATELPVILYDIPVRTGRKVSTEVLVRLAHEVPNIVALKDAAGDVAETAALLAQAPAEFEVYCGDDALTLPMLSVGAVGVISVASHWAASLMNEMVTAFKKGDVDRARELNVRLLSSWNYEGGDLTPNPIPTKALLRAIGRPAGQCRLPLGDAPDGLEARGLAVWSELHA